MILDHLQQRHEESMPLDELTQLVHQGRAGDRTVLPALRTLLDHTPALWENTQGLAAQVERAWLRVIAGAFGDSYGPTGTFLE